MAQLLEGKTCRHHAVPAARKRTEIPVVLRPNHAGKSRGGRNHPCRTHPPASGGEYPRALSCSEVRADDPLDIGIQPVVRMTVPGSVAHAFQEMELRARHQPRHLLAVLWRSLDVLREC